MTTQRRKVPVPVQIVDPAEPPHIKRAKEWLEKTRTAPSVYQPNGHSYILDLMRVAVGTGNNDAAQHRLIEYSLEVRNHPRFAEHRAISTTAGAGGNAVAPEYLQNLMVDVAKPARPVADAAQNFALPKTMQINVPKLSTGPSVASQNPQNTPASLTDLSDTLLTTNIVTIAAQEQLSTQLLEFSDDWGFDEFVMSDLAAGYGAEIDRQVIAGSGSGGQLTGIINTSGVYSIAASPTVESFYAGVTSAMNQIWSARFRGPDLIVMHSRRFNWLASLSDSSGRPLILPHAPRPAGSGGVLDRAASESVVGELFGLPIVIDNNIPTTSGAGSSDYVIVLRSRDLALWESPILTDVLRQTLASSFGSIIRLRRYAGFLVRFPTSVALVGPFTAPTFGS